MAGPAPPPPPELRLIQSKPPRAGFWRRFRRWVGFPYGEDVPLCPNCSVRMTIGEFPVYDWECPNVWCRHG